MASAILTNRNGPRVMNRFQNPNPNFNRFQNFANPNPNFNRLQYFTNPNPNNGYYQLPPSCVPPATVFTSLTPANVYGRNQLPPPSFAPPAGATFTGETPADVDGPGIPYVRYRIGTYNKRELKQLKKRLQSDLERVQILKHWVCQSPVPEAGIQPVSTVNEAVRSTLGNKVSEPVWSVPKPVSKAVPSVRDAKMTKTWKSMSVQEVKITKQSGGSKRGRQKSNKVTVMRECGKIIGNLMKHKFGWVFNKPVDVNDLKCYDYHDVIKKPMDLGTIKSKIAKNGYRSSFEFASDVRLCFNNAMEYNGKGSDVYRMAEGLLVMFEDMFKLVNPKPKRQNRGVSVNVSVVVDEPVQNEVVEVERSGWKRVMTDEEKQELACRYMNTQLMPEDMDRFEEILKKGVSCMLLERQGNEMELDLALLDDDTLWELHGFIDRLHKKPVEKCGLDGALANLAACLHGDNYRANEPERDGGGYEEEEIIDIGEEMEYQNYPSVEIEKDAVNVSSSSSSGSSSSASSSSSSSASSDSSSGNSDNDQEASNERM
ncbi:bromodomain, NET domain protein [Artemisia annua]|uniref:Bromodomain, NET domain protein n=1 Tax=Artemisia annua TaxID=35608 RepID=A0A2U1NZK5_ARTAN|nr:bromodomain, NET domain protein [Artemisia annua]